MRRVCSSQFAVSSLWLVVLLVLSGCMLQSGDPKAVPEIAYGTEALQLDLKPVNTNLYMCQETDIIATLQNTGTTDIENGIATYILEDQALKPAQNTQRKKRFTLEGRSQYNPQGGTLQLPLKLKSVELPAQLETYNTPIIFSACYEYQTLASAPVCIDPDTLNKNPSKPCTVAPVTVGGQGAPIAVTRVEPTMIPTGDQIRPTFVIYIQNLGSGRLVARDAVEEACTAATTTLTPTVDITARLQNIPLTCTQNTVRLETGKETRIACESPNTYSFSQGTFTAILDIEIDYGYINTASEQLTITKLPSQQRCT